MAVRALLARGFAGANPATRPAWLPATCYVRHRRGGRARRIDRCDAWCGLIPSHFCSRYDATCCRRYHPFAVPAPPPMQSLEAGSWCWVPHDVEMYLPGKVVKTFKPGTEGQIKWEDGKVGWGVVAHSCGVHGHLAQQRAGARRLAKATRAAPWVLRLRRGGGALTRSTSRPLLSYTHSLCRPSPCPPRCPRSASPWTRRRC